MTEEGHHRHNIESFSGFDIPSLLLSLSIRYVWGMRCRNWYKFCCLLAIEILLAEHSSAVKPMDPQNTGLQVLQQRKVAARMNRITTLLSEEATLTSSDRKELHNLMNTDTYNSNLFSEAHAQFKTVHNEVFAALGIFFDYHDEQSICLFSY